MNFPGGNISDEKLFDLKVQKRNYDFQIGTYFLLQYRI